MRQRVNTLRAMITNRVALTAILAVSAFLLLRPAWAQNPPYLVAPYTQITTPIVGTSGTTSQVVPALTINGYGARVYITEWLSIPVSGASVQWTAVPTTCGTSAVSLTSSMTFAGNQIVSVGNGSAPIMIAPAGYAVCIQTTTAAAPGFFGYSQF